MAVYTKTDTLTFRSSASHDVLAEALDDQRVRGDFCDIKFSVHGETVLAHRAVLSAHSPYFHTMFTSNFRENERGEDAVIDMTHIFSAAQHFQEVLRYIYRGTVSLSGETFEEILNGASHFLMDNLRLLCAQFMVTNLGPANCLRMWAIADRYNLENVAAICRIMAKSRFHDCIRYKQETLDMPPEFLRKVIREGVMDLMLVGEKLRFLRQWLDYNFKEREYSFREILQELLGRNCDDSNMRLSQLCASITRKSYLNVLKMVDYTLTGLQVKTQLTYPIVGLVGVLKEKRSQTNMYLNRLLAYIPDIKCWVVLGQFEHAHTVVCKQLVGFVRHFAVFKGGDSERVILVDLLKGHLEELQDVPWGSMDRIGPLPQFFCFDETIFCVVDWGSNAGSMRKSQSAPEQQHRHLQEQQQQKQLYHHQQQQQQQQQQEQHRQQSEAGTLQPPPGGNQNNGKTLIVNRRLFKLDLMARSWSEVCDLPLASGSSMHLMRYQQRQQASRVYIWAGQRKAVPQDTSIPPGWMCLSREGGAYRVRALAAPETDPLNGRAVTLSGSGHHIVVSSMASVTSQRVYDIRENTWRTQARERYVKPPPVDPLPLENHSGTTVEMPGLSSYLATDHLYTMDISCPGISRLVAYNLTGDERRWSELPPPPTERVTKYVACHLPAVVMMSAKPTPYLDETLEGGYGPLAQYTLEGCGASNRHFRVDSERQNTLAPSNVKGGGSGSGCSSSGDSSPRPDDNSRLSPGGSRHSSVSPGVNGFSFHFY